MPLGTGNDLARVLGWGAALDDDSQVPKLLESFERATTKMLDRWSMLTYEEPIQTAISPTILSGLANNTQTAIFDSSAKLNQTAYLRTLEESIFFHIANIIQNENIQNLLESTRILNEKCLDVIHRVNTICLNFMEENSEYNLKIEKKSKLLKKRLEEFYNILKLEFIQSAHAEVGPSTNNGNQKNSATSSNLRNEFLKRNSISIPTYHIATSTNCLNVNKTKLSLSSSSKTLIQNNLITKILATNNILTSNSLAIPKLAKTSVSETNLT